MPEEIPAKEMVTPSYSLRTSLSCTVRSTSGSCRTVSDAAILLVAGGGEAAAASNAELHPLADRRPRSPSWGLVAPPRTRRQRVSKPCRGVDLCPSLACAAVSERRTEVDSPMLTAVHVAWTEIDGARRLLQPERLLRQWAEAYARMLRPKLLLGLYQGVPGRW